jgi:hypothetical protein
MPVGELEVVGLTKPAPAAIAVLTKHETKTNMHNTIIIRKNFL